MCLDSRDIDFRLNAQQCAQDSIGGRIAFGRKTKAQCDFYLPGALMCEMNPPSGGCRCTHNGRRKADGRLLKYNRGVGALSAWPRRAAYGTKPGGSNVGKS